MIWALLAGAVALADPPVARTVVLNDDGGWCWFQDERALVVGDQLIVGSVANGQRDPARRGNVEVSVYDLKTGKVTRVALHERFQADDHAAPALLARPDGRLLALYTRHGTDERIYSRLSSRPRDATAWGKEQTFVPSKTSRVTYSNLLFLSAENAGRGRVFNCFRGLDNRFKPSWMFSDDQGDRWQVGGILIDWVSPKRHRPYVRYASDGKDTIHFVFTEGHPRDYDNSLYHACWKAGWLCRSDGTRIREAQKGPIEPREATCVFRGDANNVAWPQDVDLDTQGRPVVVYSVQKDSAGLPPGKGGMDHRYRYARWTGERWHDHEVAFAGKRLYAGEDDYTGGIALDPDHVERVFFSTDVDPRTGRPLPGGRYEIYAAVTPDQGKTWRSTALTTGARADNLRPLVPRTGAHRHTVLLWLRGAYRSYTNYNLEVVCQLLDRPE